MSGLTRDSDVGAEIVTADGSIREIDAGHEPDLFWAIRGGGGNFGVVTRFRLRLADVPEFTVGLLVLPASGPVLAQFISLADAAPEGLSTIVNAMPCPPIPMGPEAWHNRPVLFALMAWAGPADEGARALAPFRALAEPIADLVHPSPYPEIYPPEDGDYHPLAVSRTSFLDEVSGTTADRIITALET